MSTNQLNCKIFIGSIPPGVPEEHILNECKKHGSIENHYFCPETPNGKGWAFITYNNHSEADAAIKAMNGKLIFANTINAVEARFANVNKTRTHPTNVSNSGNRLPPGWVMYYDSNSKPYYHNESLNKTQWEIPALEDAKINNANNANRSLFGPVGANLFIFHIPNEWTDQDLFSNFTPFGQILSARIQKDPSGRNKGFGFVSYTEGRAAMSAIASMDGRQVCGKWLKVQHKKGEGQQQNSNGVNNNVNHQQQPQQQQQQQQQMNHANALASAAGNHNAFRGLPNHAAAAAAMLNSPYNSQFLTSGYNMNYYNNPLPGAQGFHGYPFMQMSHHQQQPQQNQPQQQQQQVIVSQQSQQSQQSQDNE